MDNKTEKALDEVIEKWEGIAAGTRDDLGRTDCALCVLFFRYPDDDAKELDDVMCEKCPVYQETGVSNCGKTPYSDWYSHTTINQTPRVFDDESKLYADQELGFLRSLKIGKEKT